MYQAFKQEGNRNKERSIANKIKFGKLVYRADSILGHKQELSN